MTSTVSFLKGAKGARAADRESARRSRESKIEELPDAEVPNNKEVGTKRVGEFISYPQVGKPFTILTKSFDEEGKGRLFMTSEITKILDVDKFQTLNSVYVWEVEQNDGSAVLRYMT